LGLTDWKSRDDLAALTDHVDAIDTFEADEGAERIWENSWLGSVRLPRFDLIDFWHQGAPINLPEQVGRDFDAAPAQI